MAKAKSTREVTSSISQDIEGGKVEFEFTRKVNGEAVTTQEWRSIEEVRVNLDRRAMERDDVWAFEELIYSDGRVSFSLRDKQDKIISRWRQI